MNFDPVAGIYDATRGLPPEVSDLVAESIPQAVHATEDTRFLELGVGTGRIALPIAARGYHYTGIDISQGMMDVLRGKAADGGIPIELVEGDVTALPFPDASFDAVVLVHVLHLVPEWRTALQEARRVTVPEGFLVLGGNEAPPSNPRERITEQWRVFVQELGVKLHPRHSSLEAIEEQLTTWGCYLAEYRVAQWTTDARPIDLIEAVHQRSFSQSWEVPQETLDEVNRRLLIWAREELGDLEERVTLEQEFTLRVTRWPPTAELPPLPNR